MSKKNTGFMVVASAFVGALAGGLAYYLRYKSFNDEVDKDFHDYEEEDSGENLKNTTKDTVAVPDASNRTYITLDSTKIRAAVEDENNSESEETAVALAPEETTVQEVTSESENVEGTDENGQVEDSPKTNAASEAEEKVEEAPKKVSAIIIEDDTDGAFL